MSSCIPALCLLLFALLSHLPAYGDSSGPQHSLLEESWRNASSSLVADAYRGFSNAKEASEEQQLGTAITLLNKQPRTQENIVRAKEILTNLGTSSSEKYVIFSKFFLARIHQFYEIPARPEEARRLYRELLAQWKGRPLAEQSAAELVMLDLYTPSGPEEQAARFEVLESLAKDLISPAAKRSYHLNLGNAYIDFEAAPERAVQHLLAADAIGITRWQIEAATWISIGELASAAGDAALAAKYYQKFLDKYQRDNRHYTVRKKLAALVAQTRDPESSEE